MFSFFFTLVLVAGVIVVDFGFAFVDRRHIQNTVDIMALAGAQELPADPALAELRAEEWAALNGITAPKYTIEVSTDNSCWNTDPFDDPAVLDSMTVRISRPSTEFFASNFGLPSMNIGASANACWGGASGPLVIVIDRTGSMGFSDLTNAKNAAKSVLTLFDPQLQQVAFGVLGPSSLTSLCTSSNSGGRGRATSSGGS